MSPDDLTPLELRLRGALRQVAESTPVVDAFDRLGEAAGDGMVVPLDDRERPPVRRRLLVAAAAIIALVAGALVASPWEGDDDTDIVAVTPEAPTGFYLPSDPDGPWELAMVEAKPVTVNRGGVRRVVFTSGGTGETEIVAEVTTAPSSATPRRYEREEVVRGTGTAQRTYEVLTSTEAADVSHVVGARAPEDGFYLSLTGYYLDEVEPLLAMADRWWESGGRDLSVDPALGLRRDEDDELRPPHPGAPGLDQASLDSVDAAVALTFREPSGRVVDLTLTPLGAAPRPTGTNDDDRGAAAGLAEDDRPRPLDVEGFDRAWSWAGNAIVAPRVRVEHAGVGIDLVGRWDASASSPAPIEVLLDLLAALEPVDAGRWADVVRDFIGGDQAVAPDLASVPIPPASRQTSPTPTTGR